MYFYGGVWFVVDLALGLALDEPTPPDETRLPVHAAGQHHSLGAGVAGNDVARVAR